MNELIKIEKQTMGNEKINTVSARDLWEFLEVKTEFSKWIIRKIKKYDFIKDEDYISFVKNVDRKIGSSIRKEYYVSIDMAKELSMVENNKRGKEARRYFIKCEKQLKENSINEIKKSKPINQLTTLEIVAKEFKAGLEISDIINIPKSTALIETAKIIYNIHNVDYRNVISESKYLDNIPEQEIMLEPTELGKYFKLSAIKMNKYLEELGLQEKDVIGWKITDLGIPISSRHQWSRGGKSGYNYKWNLKKLNEYIEEK